MPTVLVLFIILNVAILVLFIIRVKQRSAASALLPLTSYLLSIGVALLFIGLAEAHLLPSSFYFIGPTLIMGLGIMFVISGVRKRVDFQEELMKISPRGPDRIFLEIFGTKYFYFKSIVLGVVFVLFGIFLIFHRI